ncbi:ABC transporter permease [Homoserinimonas aerilata]|uniref:ABC transporter permease n=1 Tax=Homoserinimonas aerilata TaxID=1162970 RepID=UPI001639E7BF|nr:ABC transporter permease subunit [Homoserinimonas aerilata]
MARLIVALLAIGCWQLAVSTTLLPANVLPAPFSVVESFATQIISPDYWKAIGDTFAGALLGLAFGIIVGVPVGMLTGRRPLIELSTRFLFDFGRAFPAIALIPVLILLLGRTTDMKAVVVFTAVVFPIIVQAQHGVRSVTASIEETVRSFRIPPHLVVLKVMLPSAAPFLATGFRLGATIAVLVSLGTEVLTGAAGVGAELGEAQQGGDTPLAYVFLLTACILGFAVSAVVSFAQDRLIRWQTEGNED